MVSRRIDSPGKPGVLTATALEEPTSPLLPQRRGGAHSSTGKPWFSVFDRIKVPLPRREGIKGKGERS